VKVKDLIAVLRQCRQEDNVMLIEYGDQTEMHLLKGACARYLGHSQIPIGMVFLVPETKEKS